MKKLISKILTLVLSVTLVLTMFAGCDWVTTVVDRDMDQVVATVNISSTTSDADLKGKLDDDNIYKRELIAGFLSYGYQYVSSYGYTTSKAYQLILDNLISNKVIVQLARYEMSKNNGVQLKYTVDADKKGLDASYVQHLKSYLSEYEYANAIYLVKSSVNSMVDSFADSDEEDEETEDVTYTLRTTPTKDSDSDTSEEALKEQVATAYDVEVAKAILGYDELTEVPADFTTLVAGELSVYDLNMYVFNNYKIDFTSEGRKQASSKLFDYLETNGLNKEGYKWAKNTSDKLSDKENYYDVKNPDECLKTTYVQSLIVSRLESALISKYEETLTEDIENEKLSNEGLWEQYKVEYTAQEALYRNNVTDYETALSSASDTSFVLYNPFEGYGYVSNLLIGFSDAQSALLKDYSSKQGITKEDIVSYRANLLKDLLASDQRTSWVYNNLGTYVEAEGVSSFTFDGDYLVSEDSTVKSFVGTVVAKDAEGKKVEDSNGVKKDAWEYSQVVADQMSFESFYDNFVKVLLGDAKYFEAVNDSDKFGQVTYSDELYDKWNDLLFAFSTDTGCLNKDYGYLYSPFTSATQYVSEFAEAAKLVVSKGVGAYTIVATDYGYHIIICTKLVENPYEISDAGKADFLADLNTEGTLAYNYKKVKSDAVVSTEISKKVEKDINPYVDDEDDQYAVTLFEKTYSDLITDEE